MPYAPGVQYRGDVYRNQATSELFKWLSGYLTDQKKEADRHDELVQTLASIQPDDADAAPAATAPAATAGPTQAAPDPADWSDLRNYPQGMVKQDPADWSDLRNYPSTARSASTGGFDPTTGGAAGPQAKADDLETQGKRAQALRSVITSYKPEVATHLKGLSTAQLEGVLKGFTMKGVQAEQQARIAEMGAKVKDYQQQMEMRGPEQQARMDELAARTQDYQEQAALRSQYAKEDIAAGNFVNSYMQAPRVSSGLVGDYGDEMSTEPTTQQRWSYAAGATPNFGGRIVPKVIDSLTKYQQSLQEDAPVVKPGPYPGTSLVMTRSGGVHVVTDPNQGAEGAPKFATHTVPETGATFATFGKQMQPAGYDPRTVASKAVPLHDTDGRLIGWSIQTARGTGNFVKATGGPLRQATDSQGNVLAGYYLDDSGKLHDTRSALEKTVGPIPTAPSTNAPAKAAVKNLPTVKTKAERDKLKAGTSYIGPDGEVYVKQAQEEP